MHDSGASRRESANARLGVIARSEATKQSILSSRGEMDCFAALAMTVSLSLGCLKSNREHAQAAARSLSHKGRGGAELADPGLWIKLRSKSSAR